MLLHNHFKNVPGFVSCRLRHGKPTAASPNPLIGFIEFETPEDAKECLQRMDNCYFYGQTIALNFAKSILQGRPSTGTTVFVSKLPPDTTQRELGHLFRPFNGYISLRFQQREHPNPFKRAFAFVEFDTVENAAACIAAMQQYYFSEDDDVPITVEFAVSTSSRSDRPVVRTRN